MSSVRDAKTNKSDSIWKMLWPRLRPSFWPIALAMTLNAAHGIAIAYQVLIPAYIIDNVLKADDVLPEVKWRRLAWILTIYLVSSIFGRMLLWHLSYRVFTRVREKVVFSLRLSFFKHLNELCLRFHNRTNSGELYSYLFGSPLQQVQMFLQQFAMSVPGSICAIVSVLSWVMMWDWATSLVLGLSVGTTVLLMQLVRQKIRKLHTEYQQLETNVSGYVADLIRGTRDVKLYAMEDRAVHDFEEKVWSISKKSWQRDVNVHVQWMKQETAGYVCFAILCLVGVWRVLTRHLEVGQMTGCMTAFIALQQPLQNLFMISTQKNAAEAGLRRINTVLETASTTPDPIIEAFPLPRQGTLRFCYVSFAYEPSRPVLKDVSLTVPYGQHVALVGPSGGGKSTLSQLMLRMYDPDIGAVVIGGLQLRHCKGADVRERFGVVPQDPFIFRTTVRENLLVARRDATEAQLREACLRANAWEYIERMPNGLDSIVGEGGSTLSGGQRQRLAIARALLKEPDYFILDEATSALDTVSERLIQDALHKAMAGRTAVIIAHRLATVKHCDRILVVCDGEITQDGTYETLVKQDGIFRNLVEGQKLMG